MKQFLIAMPELPGQLRQQITDARAVLKQQLADYAAAKRDIAAKITSTEGVVRELEQRARALQPQIADSDEAASLLAATNLRLSSVKQNLDAMLAQDAAIQHPDLDCFSEAFYAVKSHYGENAGRIVSGAFAAIGFPSHLHGFEAHCHIIRSLPHVQCDFFRPAQPDAIERIERIFRRAERGQLSLYQDDADTAAESPSQTEELPAATS